MNMNARYLARAGAIGAVYAALTVCLAPISSGLIQCRVSECMCVLPYFTGAAVPGLFLGCLIANLLTGAPVYDVLFGSLATLLAALATRYLRRRWSKFLSPLPSVLFNSLIVGWVLVYAYGVGVPYWLSCLYVGAGQALACFGVGIPLLLATEKYGRKLFWEGEAWS